MAMEYKSFRMVILLEETIKTENLMVMANIFGFVGQFTKDSFLRDLDQVKEAGLVNMEINIMVILVMIEKMDMVNIHG